MFEKSLGFKCDETFIEETALQMIKRSLEENNPYKFIVVDLDDPSMMLGRFMSSFKNLTAQIKEIAGATKIDVYAASSTSSARVLRICE